FQCSVRRGSSRCSHCCRRGSACLELGEIGCDRCELELAEKSLDARMRALEPPVVADSGDVRYGEARLIRVDLPRMDVERCRLAAITRLLKSAANHTEWKLSEIPPTGRRNRVGENSRRRQRELRQPPRWSLDQMRHTLGAGISVSGPPYGEQTRVIAIPFLEQNIASQFAAGHNREIGRAIPDNRAAGHVLERVLGGSDIFAKGSRIEGGYRLMPVPVRCHLVSRVCDRAYDMRAVFCQPTQNEKRPAGSMPVQARQQRVDAARNAARVGDPLVAPHHRLHCFYLEILLDIYGEEMRGRDLCRMHGKELGLHGRRRKCADPHERTSNARVKAGPDSRRPQAISLRHNDKHHSSNTRTRRLTSDHEG